MHAKNLTNLNHDKDIMSGGSTNYFAGRPYAKNTLTGRPESKSLKDLSIERTRMLEVLRKITNKSALSPQ